MQNSCFFKPAAEKLVDLNDLRVFACVASLASFSLAADALQIHKSSVSRSIARLELLLDAPLLLRTTRKVLLTQRGIDLKERCEDIFSLIDRTIGCKCIPDGSGRNPFVIVGQREDETAGRPVTASCTSCECPPMASSSRGRSERIGTTSM